MPKVPLYNPTQGTRTTGTPRMSTEIATGPAKALGGLADTVGQAGGILVKLQEQRNIRLNNIEALNLFTQYNEEVRGLTDGALSKEGSDAMDLYPSHEKALQELSKKYMDMGSNERVRDMFVEHAYHASESSKGQVVAHQAKQEKVARDQAIENLIESHKKAIDDTPGNEAGLNNALAMIGKEVDMHYPAEQAIEIKNKAGAALKAEYLLTLSTKDAKAASAKLKEWEESGTFDFKTADYIRTQIKQVGDDSNRDTADRVLMSTFGNNDGAKIRYLMSPANRDKLGLTLDQADKLSGMYSQRLSFAKSMERMAKEDNSDRITRDVLAMIEKGDVAGATKVYATSMNLTGGDRSLLHSALQFKVAQDSDKASRGVYQKIINGEYTKETEVIADTMGLRADDAREIRKFYSEMQQGDKESYKLALDKFQDAKKQAPFKAAYKSVTDSDFLVLLKNAAQKDKLHGSDILEKADKLIGQAVPGFLGFGKKVQSEMKPMIENKQVGLEKEGKNPEKKTKPVNAAQSPLLSYDKSDVEKVRSALKAAYPGRTITDEDVHKTLLLNNAKKKAQ